MRGSAATIRQRLGVALFAIGVALVAWAVVIVIAGGLTISAGGVTLAARDGWRPLGIAALLLLISRVALGGSRFGEAVDWCVGVRGGRAARGAAIAAAATFVFAVAWNTRAVGGSDSSCYALQAEALARGHATLPPAIVDLPSGVPAAALAPGGFLPSRSAPDRAVPICGPGLALAMALPYVVHPDAIFLVVPLSAALLVWLTFAFGRRVADERVGICAAVLMTCSPIFLYQAVQPMSDVPASAAWLAALTFAVRGGRRDALLAGLCASLAVLTRANLAVLVLPLLPLLENGDSPRFPARPKRGQSPFSIGGGFRGKKPGQSPFPPAEKRGQSPFPAAAKLGQSPFLWFAAGAAPGVALMLALNVARYGGPLASGYGETGSLFSWAHVTPNLARYPRWLLETHTPLPLLALAAPFAAARGRRVAVSIALLCAALLVATYLAYTVFEDWWYLRFLLPALPVLFVGAGIVLERLADALPPAARRLAAPMLVLLVAGWYLDQAFARQVFALRGLEARFRLAGTVFARRLPADAVALAGQHTGSIRFHGARPTLAWDALPPGGLDAAIRGLEGGGMTPVIVLEDEELGPFRARFRGQEFAELDWPPAVELHTGVRVRLYDVRQRRPYRDGKSLTTEHIWP